MGNGASSSNSKLDGAKPPPGIRKVNDAVWELHNPGGIPQVEIIFFHGLVVGDYGNAFWKTWLARADDSVVWPKDWLGKSFPNARILSISYNSSATNHLGQLDMFCIGENLVSDIILDGHNIGQDCPVILVGHSFGGIVIKQFILSASKAKPQNSQRDIHKTSTFLENFKGVFYYATPHGGSQMANFAMCILGSSQYLRLLQTLDKDLARINQDFKIVRENSNKRAYAIAESRPTVYLGFSAFVVEEGSARLDIDTFFTAENANHFEVCRPEDMTSGIYLKLSDFISGNLEEAISNQRDVRIDLQPNKERGYFENFQQLPRGALGLDLCITEVQQKLQDNATVGIFGMGGKGKTTLAKAVFNKLNPTFEYSCFVPDVKLIAGMVEDVKKEVWKRMHRRGKKVGDEQSGHSELRGRRLLLVLDDVAQDRDLEVIFNIVDEVAPEVCCIVTTRNRELLNSFDVSVCPISFLSQEDAKQLFVSHAFSTHAAAPHGLLEKHVDAIVKKCEGLPLTLEVLGKYLKSKGIDAKMWEQTLEALDNAEAVANFDERLWKKLRLSYSGLGEQEQEIFLDATTFFSCKPNRHYEWTLRQAKAAWSVIYGMEQIRWQTLVDMSLVYDVNEDEHIKVHEQLQSLGREIASESKNGKWRVRKSKVVLDLLKSTDESNDQHIYSLRLSQPDEGPNANILIPRSCLGRFRKLQYLDVDPHIQFTIDGAEENETLPTDLALLQTCRFQLGQVHIDPAFIPNLTVLTLSYTDTLKHLPSSFGRLSALRILTISYADELESLPDEIGHLSQLERVIFHSCLRLRTVPKTFGHLSNLEHLQFSFCPMLDTLPSSFGELSTLAHLSFHDCIELHILPESFWQLSALKHLSFYYYENYGTLPESFGQLSALEHLSFSHCDNMHILPESFGQLSALALLSFRYCDNLRNLPESFGQLSALMQLSFDECNNVQTLPDSFAQLSMLKHLSFSRCDKLCIIPESFGQLSTLEHLSFCYCDSMETLPESFGQLSTLKHLSFDECNNLKTLPESFAQLSNLKHLSFDKCNNLKTLPESFAPLSMLEHLSFDECNHLQTLPSPESFGQLKNLEFLKIYQCPGIDSLPFSSSQLPVALRHLSIGFIAVTRIPDCIKSFPSLQVLELGSLPDLNSLPPWLGENFLGRPSLLPKTFHVQDGNFALQFEENLTSSEQDTVTRWIHEKAMVKVRRLHYTGALADLGTLDVGILKPKLLGFILAERGIIKRWMGDLGGGLEDVNFALEKYKLLQRKYYWGQFRYQCLIHRGFIRYLLGDKSGARDDAQEVLELQFKYSGALPSPNLGEEGVNYLDFRLVGRVQREKQERLLSSSHSQAMQRVQASDLDGALAALALVDSGVLGHDARAFFFQERGIVKRLMGDLVGALADLTDALEINEEGYESRKHRGFVKYLLADLDGARMDAERASGIIEVLPRQGVILGESPVSFLEFSLV